MIVIVDTNVIVSATLRRGKPSDLITYIFQHPGCEWVISESIRKEYEEVICRPKFDFPPQVIEDWFRIFSLLTSVEDQNVSIDFPRDRSDVKFLQCAIASDADYFITGDGDFRDLKTVGRTSIVTVSEFLSRHL